MCILYINKSRYLCTTGTTSIFIDLNSRGAVVRSSIALAPKTEAIGVYIIASVLKEARSMLEFQLQ